MKSNLETLAIKLCESFLTIRDSKYGYVVTDKQIGLYGANQEVLEKLKDQMISYLKAQKVDIGVVVGKKGYTYDVGWCLRTFSSNALELN